MIEMANLLNAIKNLCLGQTLKLNILIYKNELMNSFIVLELQSELCIELSHGLIRTITPSNVRKQRK